MYETDLLLLISFILTFVYLQTLFRDFMKYHKVFRRIQGPPTLPMSLIAYIFTAQSESDRFQILQSLSRRYKDYYSLWFGTKYLFVTDEPSIAQKLLTYPQCIEKNFFMELFGFSNGLISLKSDRWKNERKLLNPSFSLPILQSYIPHFDKCIVKSIERLMKKCDIGEFDIRHDISTVTMNAVMNTTLGQEFPESLAQQFMINTEKLLDTIWKRSMNALYWNDSIYSLTSLKRHEDSYRQFIFEFISNEWNKLLMDNDPSAKCMISGNSFLHQLLKLSKSGRNYTEEEIRDHIGTMLVAAADTTSTALNFLILMLAMHENVQQRIIEEINEVFGECNDLIITYEKLSELKYVEMAIKETLRLFSPATGIFREVKADVDLDIEGVVLPKGTNLIINIYGLHRKESVWGENATKFDPQHFHPDEVSKRHPYSLLSFANGTRMCIGNRYAMILMKMVVVHYVKNFKLSTSLTYEKTKVKAGITLKLIGKHLIKISRREKLTT